MSIFQDAEAYINIKACDNHTLFIQTKSGHCACHILMGRVVDFIKCILLYFVYY